MTFSQINFISTTYSSNTLRREDPDNRFWHVDYPYHNLKSPYPDRILGLQVIFTLHDFTEENGGTWYIPGSYKNHSFPPSDAHLRYPDKIKRVVVPAGSVIIYRGDIWHSQGLNMTDSPRSALLANFSPLYVPAKDNMIDQITHKSLTKGLEVRDGKVMFN